MWSCGHQTEEYKEREIHSEGSGKGEPKSVYDFENKLPKNLNVDFCGCASGSPLPFIVCTSTVAVVDVRCRFSVVI